MNDAMDAGWTGCMFEDCWPICWPIIMAIMGIIMAIMGFAWPIIMGFCCMDAWCWGTSAIPCGTAKV